MVQRLFHRDAWHVTAARALSIFLILASGPALLATTPTGEARDDASPDVVRLDSSGRTLPPGMTPETVEAIDRGLAFLVRVQDRQGAWTNRTGYGQYPVAMTALAGLALLMDGNSTTQGRYAPNVDRAMRYLLRQSTSTGLLARGETDPRPMFGHGYSMLFLGELGGMIEDPERGRELHEALARAVVLTTRAQSREGGWIYTPTGASDEGAVTITQLQGLRSCRNIGVAVPKKVIDDAMDYLARSQNSDGGIRYSLRHGGAASRVPISAAAVACWFNAGEYTNPRALRALEFSKEQMPPSQALRGHDYYGHLYLAQALFVSGDPYWDYYYPARRDYLLNRQSPDGSWFGDGVGEVYGTALALIVLQLPYNIVPIMQR